MRPPDLGAPVRSIVSLVMVGRDDLVASAERRLALTANGEGHLRLTTRSEDAPPPRW